MFYVFGAQMSWILAALAIGFAVGWLTTRRAGDAEFSGGWAVLIGLLLIGAGFAISSSGAISGRNGLIFDTGVWLATSYAAGLPLGGVAKMFAPAPAPERIERPKIVVVRGEPAAEAEDRPAAASAAAEAAPLASADTAPPAPVGAAPPAPADAAPIALAEEPIRLEKAPPRKANASKAAARSKPDGLAAARNGAPDDLSKIKGVGPKSREKLHALGVFHYDQIAAWTPEEARWIGEALGIPGRVERNEWIAQAKSLAGDPP